MQGLVRNSITPGDTSLQTLEVPTPSGTYLLAKVAYAGICASDLDILYHRNTIYQPPVVQGHEFSAVVEAVGDQVEGFKRGDLITSETTLYVEDTPEAHRMENYQLMAGKRIVGWTVNGGFAEYVLLNSLFCHKFSDKVNPKVAALAEPTAIATESVLVRGQLAAGDTVVVIGPGPIGILCALVAKYYGKAKKVFLIGLPSDADRRLSVARQLGITHCYTTDDKLPKIISKENNGTLANMVVDATGSIKGYESALNLVKRSGQIVQAGSITEDTLFSWERAAYLALTLTFVFSSSRRAWDLATDFINTTDINLEQLVSACFSLEDYEHAFAAAENTSDHIKVMFKPNTNE